MKILKTFIHFMKEAFIDGILFLLPLSAVVIVLKFIINFVSSGLLPLRILLPEKIAGFIPYVEILLGIILAIFLGSILRTSVLNMFAKKIEENIINNIPLVSSLYFAVKRISQTMYPEKSSKAHDFQKVAWVKVPAKNMYCLGLMTSIVREDLVPEKGRNFYCFFVPHTPNPISGYYVVVPEEECVFVDITRQEALSIIMSAGVVQPDKK